ncbi:MAG: hypothetical protein WDM89_22415 [Rhizomicrobium sp.]
MKSLRLPGLVFAVHPTTNGFGWILFEQPDMPLDWGIATAKAGRKLRIVNRFERLLTRHDPDVLVMEVFEGSGSNRSERIQALCHTFIRSSAARGLDTQVYDREAVRDCLGLPMRASRHDVTTSIARRVADLSHRLPRKRNLWNAEDPRQSLFHAAALAFTHFATNGHDLPPPAHSGAPE